MADHCDIDQEFLKSAFKVVCDAYPGFNIILTVADNKDGTTLSNIVNKNKFDAVLRGLMNNRTYTEAHKFTGDGNEN